MIGLGIPELLGLLLIVLLKGLALIAVVVLIVWACRRGRTAATAPPLDLLNARYARGELTREQYLQMRQDLASG